MSKKKVIALMAAISIVATVFVGCAKAEPTTPTTPAKAKVKIGLSTDEGGLNDKSFNQAADTGVKKAQAEFDLDYKAVESKTKDDYSKNLGALVAEKCNLVFGVGFQMADAITEAAKQYPESKFAIIDSVVDLPNVESITFKEHEGSFLMGVIAGKMTKTNKIGFIGGKDFDLINRFEVGFAAGVMSVNPEAAKGLMPKDDKTPGTMIKYADSFGDVAKGTELAKQLYDAGCDVIYHAAGGVGLGLFKEALDRTKGGKAVWAIGVDLDQAVTAPEYASVILSSMLKRVDTATYNSSKEIANGTFQGGKVLTLGLKEDGVAYAPSTNKNTPADVIALVDKYSTAVKDGKIVVPDSRATMLTFKAVEVK